VFTYGPIQSDLQPTAIKSVPRESSYFENVLDEMAGNKTFSNTGNEIRVKMLPLKNTTQIENIDLKNKTSPARNLTEE
jgi:hypothetical protein